MFLMQNTLKMPANSSAKIQNKLTFFLYIKKLGYASNTNSLKCQRIPVLEFKTYLLSSYILRM